MVLETATVTVQSVASTATAQFGVFCAVYRQYIIYTYVIYTIYNIHIYTIFLYFKQPFNYISRNYVYIMTTL